MIQCCGDDAGGMPPAGADGGTVFEPVIAAVETSVAPDTFEAGLPLRTECLFLDAEEEVVRTAAPGEAEAEAVVEPAGSFVTDHEGFFVPARVGDAGVRCLAPALGLVDTSPEPIAIVPGTPEVVLTDLPGPRVAAGSPLEVGCRAFDAFGNSVPSAEARVTLAPSGEGAEIDGRTVQVTRAGRRGPLG